MCAHVSVRDAERQGQSETERDRDRKSAQKCAN